MKYIKQISIIFILFVMIISDKMLIADDFVYTIDKSTAFKPKIAVILSGGGARSLSHIGSLKCLEENDINFDCIAGTSMGAIIGGIYSSGYSIAQLDSIFRSIAWNDIIADRLKDRQNLSYFDKLVEDRNLLTLYINDSKLNIPEGIYIGYKLNDLLYNLLLNSTYYKNDENDSLKYDFIAVATDLVSAKSVVLKEGCFIQNLRASSAIPLYYIPVRKDTMILTDGGLFANLPVRIAKNEFNADINIAFNACSPLYTHDEINNPIKIIDQSLSISMVREIEEDAKYADVLISPELDNYSNEDYDKVDSIINSGYNSTKQNIDIIRGQINDILDSCILKSELYYYIGDKKLIYSNFYLDSRLSLEELTNNKEKLKYLNNLVVNGIYKNIDFRAEDSVVYVSAVKYNHLSHINANGYYSSFIKDSLAKIETLFKKHSLNDKLISHIKEKVLTIYKNCNIPYVDLKFQIEQDTILNVYIVESIVRNIIISGNKTISSKTITNEFGIKINEILNANKLLRGYNNLLSLNLFSEVNLDVEQLPNGCSLIINVHEQGIQNISITGKIDNERNFVLGLDFIHANILDKLVKNVLHFHSGYINRYVSDNLIIPRIFGTPITMNFNIYYDWQKRNIFNKTLQNNRYKTEVIGNDIFEKIGLEAVNGVQIQKNGFLGVAYRFEKQNLKEYNIDGYSSNWLSTLKLNFNYDTEDNNFFTKKGATIAVGMESNFFTPRENAKFTKMKFSASKLLRYKDFLVKPQILFLVGDRTMPYMECFTLGGQYNFFGYRENEEVGRQLFRSSLDFKQQLPKELSILTMDTYLGFRYDLGAVWVEPESIKFSTLKHGIGLSLMLDTPVGPASFSVGKMFSLLRLSNNDIKALFGPTLLYFSIGAYL